MCADQNLVALPETVDFETAAALGCRFITAYWALTNQGRLRAGEKMAVFGCGGLGLAAVQIGAAIGAEVYAVDVRESSCAQALELGAVAAINASHTDAVSTILDLSGGGVHLSVDALGSMETCLNAISCLRRKGRHVQAGLLTGSDADISLPLPRLIGEELEIIGSHGMPAWNYKPMFNFLEKHELDPGKLVTRHIGLNQLPQALENLDSSDQSGIVVVNSFR